MMWVCAQSVDMSSRKSFSWTDFYLKFENMGSVNFPWMSPDCPSLLFTMFSSPPFQTSTRNHTYILHHLPSPLLPFPPSPLPPCTSLIPITPTFPSSSSALALALDPTCAPCSGWWGRRRSTSARVETGTSAPSAAGGRKSGARGFSGLSHLDSSALAFQKRFSHA